MNDKKYLWKKTADETPEVNTPAWVKYAGLDMPVISTYLGDDLFLVEGKQRKPAYWLTIPLPETLEHIEKILVINAKNMETTKAGLEKYGVMLQTTISGLTQIMKLKPESNLIVPREDGSTGNVSQSIAAECLIKLQTLSGLRSEDKLSNVLDLYGRRLNKGA